MNPEQAYQVIEQAIDVATKSGAFGLQDVNNCIAALATLQEVIKPKPAEVDKKDKP